MSKIALLEDKANLTNKKLHFLSDNISNLRQERNKVFINNPMNQNRVKGRPKMFNFGEDMRQVFSPFPAQSPVNPQKSKSLKFQTREYKKPSQQKNIFNYDQNYSDSERFGEDHKMIIGENTLNLLKDKYSSQQDHFSSQKYPTDLREE